MPFPELEKYKRQVPQLSELITKLEAYLTEVSNRPISGPSRFDHAAFDIVPILVAKSLGIDENLSLVLLNIFQEAGIIEPRYHIYCPNIDSFIVSIASKKDLPDSISCPFELRTEHTIDEYFVELVFNFSATYIREHNLAVSM